MTARRMNAVPGKKGFQAVPLADRFWSKVQKGEGCWLWTGTTSCRYGSLWVDGRLHKAHIVSWELATGETKPPGGVIMHTCDAPACVRPDHLRLGTQRENLRDAVAKGRWAGGRSVGLANGAYTHPERVRQGEAHHAAKLSEEDVRTIRGLHGQVTHRALAQRFGVSQSLIQQIVYRQAWRHV